MIYLLQDSYLDDQDNSHKVLKIGYSKNSFQESRKSHYDTHNYGYKFLGEREGGIELESFLHKKYNSLRLEGEWFQWSQEIIDEFPNINTLEDNITREEYLGYLIEYILSKLSLDQEKLKELYLKELLEELKETYDSQPEHQCFSYDEDLLKQRILCIWELAFLKEYEFWSSYDLKTVPTDASLNLPQIIKKQRISESVFREDSKLFRKILISESERFLKKNFDKIIQDKLDGTESRIRLYNLAPHKEYALSDIRLVIRVYKYSESYVGIDEKTKLPKINRLVMLAEQRAIELYNDEMNSSANSGNNDILSEFMEQFRKSTTFINRMKLVCQFTEIHGGYVGISKILELSEYTKYIDLLGIKRIKNKNYNKERLDKEAQIVANERNLIFEITNSFIVGEKYTLKEIKEKLWEIYQNLGISKIPKASSLLEYYSTKVVYIWLSEEKKQRRGYKLLKFKQ